MSDANLAFIDRSDRVRLEIHGPDRAKFLHNLTTNDVKRLPVGKDCEAFVTSLQGKTLGYVTLLACEDHILLRTDPGALETLLPHLQKYGVFDDVEIRDVSARTFEFHLMGTSVKPGRSPADWVLLASCYEYPQGDLSHAVSQGGGPVAQVVSEAPSGRSGWTFIGDRAGAVELAEFLHRDSEIVLKVLNGKGSGATDLSPADFDVLRIEAGTPVFGRDVTPDNLPQEVGRDALAINFVKGCYLGQETVARIDALGHVNKVLKGLKIEGSIVPPPGTALERDGKAVGAITSSAFSTGWGTPIALAYVRVQHAQPGTVLRAVLSEGTANAVVADLPMLPPEGQTPSSG